MIRLFKGLALVLVLFLSGCTTLPHKQPEMESTPTAKNDLNTRWLQRQSTLASLNHWQFKSRTSIREAKESWQAGLRWKQASSDYEVQVLGPFSMGGIKLEGDGVQVVLTLADGRRWQASSPDTLLAEATNRKLPITALRYWVRGLPAMTLPSPEKTLNDQAQITEMTQGDWQVKFTEYIKVKNQTLPRKIRIENKKADLHVKMVIDKWTLAD